MQHWHFTLILDRTLTEDDMEPFAERGEDLGNPENGSLTPTCCGPDPSEVACWTPGISLLDAVVQAAYTVTQATGARPVRVEVAEEHRRSLHDLAAIG
ncbi:hypothetical protein JJV70_17980 [Streptomyces sp. JJ66]|uniref:hypothetical protein n=1 Tax=Streptomyces sp. JJ66 TaxID=2803843 RepID=UPI001C598845|nr:hypothetical protein [Streptomyces sp. JJ66]MBW1603957.1 hypothetical protein [Streptomyces sp. JJ66]